MKDRQAPQDLWHLTIDDLFTQSAETPRQGGDGPFVINLSTSTAPISIPPKDQLNIDGLRVYQISRTEDGRQRFRLRIGAISTELEADAILSAVRERYPSAMIATAADDDLRAIASAERVAKSAKAPKPKPVQPNAVALPEPAETAKHDDSTEITGSGWDLDSLLPHLSGPAPRAKKPAPKAQPKAKPAVAAPARQNPPEPSKPAAPQAPAVAKASIATPPAKSPPAANPASAPVVAKPQAKQLAAPPPVLTTPAAPVAKAKPAPTPPVLTKPVAPPASTPARKPPASAKPPPAPPAAEPVAPSIASAPRPAAPPAAELTPPVTAPVAPPIAAERQPPVAAPQPASPLAAATAAPSLAVEAAAPVAAPISVAPVVAQEPVPPVAAPKAVAPVVAAPVAPTIEIEFEIDPPAAAPPSVSQAAAPEVAPPAAVTATTSPPATASPPPPATAAIAPPSPVAVATPPAIAKAPPPVTIAVASSIAAQTAPPAAKAEVPNEPILETDWASILSAPIDDAPHAPAPAVAAVSEPTPPAPVTTSTPPVPQAAASAEDSGLRRLVEKSNAIVDRMEARTDAVAAAPPPASPAAVIESPRIAVTPPPAPAPMPQVAAIDAVPQATRTDPPPPLPASFMDLPPTQPVTFMDLASPAPAQVAKHDAPPVMPEAESVLPAAGFSPLTTQSIEQKLARLAEILHVGEQDDAAPLVPVLPVEAATQAPAPVDHAPPPATMAREVEVDIFIDDASEPAAPADRHPWFEVERRREPRPMLKSPTQVLTAIDEMVIVDEANNLESLVAKEKERATGSTSKTSRMKALAPPVEAPPAVDAPPPAAAPPVIEEVIVDLAPAPPVEAPATKLTIEAELSLEPELTLAPADPAPAPVLIEDLIETKADRSLEILVQKSNALVDSLGKQKPLDPVARVPEALAKKPAPPVKAPVADAAEPPPVKVAASDPPPKAAEEVSVVSTVVLEDPAAVAKAAGDVPHVATVVLDPPPSAAPVVIRSRESAADHSTKGGAPLTHRAAARAAKKLRAAKHAAKQAALAAAKTGSMPALKDTSSSRLRAPDATTPPAAAKSEGPAPKATAPAPQSPQAAAKTPTPPPRTPAMSEKKPGKAVTVPSKPHAEPTKPAPAHAKPNPPPAAAASGNGAKPAERKVKIRTEHSPAVDSTQTMRALTPLELADDQASKWFVIQLALSEDDFDPDHIPQLDIFEAYRLYSVIGLDQNRIMHALRLGFFSDEISAQFVTTYVKAHFDNATVKRVSIAERERFAESNVEARKDIGATGMHAIIEMASPKPVPERSLADLRAENGQSQPEEKSLWSRLVSPLKRP
jgi:Meckel syndrome type 1 protein